MQKNEDFEELEKVLIKIIGMDSKNLKAFDALGKLYVDKKNFDEAKQTFGHILKLLETSEDDEFLGETYFNIADIEKGLGQSEEAFKALKQALHIKPNNPRYLDSMVEICIMNKDKGNALDAYAKLKEVNPENNKLEEIKKKIDEI